MGQWDTVQGLMGQWDTVQGLMGQWNTVQGVGGTVGHSAGGGWDSDTDRNSVRALTNVLSTSDSEISSK